MELKWVRFKEMISMKGEPSTVHSRLVDGELGTKYFLFCDKHWDTGAPDEWIVSKGAQTVSFPSQAEAKNYAEATYTLEGASHGA